MYVEEIGSGEEYLLKILREKYGYNIPICASFDFHGNMKLEIVNNLNVATAYRTDPHIDEQETRERAVLVLIKCIESKILPTVKMISIPIMLPGEKVITANYPSNKIIDRLNSVIDYENILDISLFCGFVWVENEYMSM